LALGFELTRQVLYFLSHTSSPALSLLYTYKMGSGLVAL
jgi:hypothetical protein